MRHRSRGTGVVRGARSRSFETPNVRPSPYIRRMLWRERNGRPKSVPPGFIHPCRPTLASKPPVGPGWAHELKHDGYRLQIHARGGRVRLYTMNGADWTERYPLIVAEASRIKGYAVIDAEVICAAEDGIADFETLHSRCADHAAVAVGFDLLRRDGTDFRPKPLAERKAELARVLAKSSGGIQYVAHV
jgi:ATP-dependent DNA ligase